MAWGGHGEGLRTVLSVGVVSISSLAAVCGLLIVVASLVREPWL